MRKLVIRSGVLVMLAALLLGGAYGFYWYQVKSFVDRLVEEALPQARVAYGSIYAHPLGEVGVDDVAITLTQDGTRIPIRSIRVRSDPLFFFDPQGRIEAGNWPQTLSLSLQQVQLSLASPLLRTLEQQDRQVATSLPGGVSMNALACGEQTTLGLEALREMGYGQMVMDTSVQLQVMAEEGRFRLSSDFDMADMGDGYASVEISVSGNDLSPAQLLAANPRLRRLELSFQDAGYNARRNRFCAEQAGSDVEQYLAQRQRLISAWLLAQGVQLPEPLEQLYQALEAPGSQFELVLEPPGGLGAEVMAALNSPAQLVERLNMRGRLNGEPVTLNQMRWSEILVEPRPEVLARLLNPDAEPLPEEQAQDWSPDVDLAAPALVESEEPGLPESMEAEKPLPTEAAEDNELLQGLSKNAPEPEAKRYRAVPLTQLAELTGRLVRVRTELGNLLEGRVIEVNPQVLKIEQRIDRGVIVYPLGFEQIRAVEVYH